MQNQHPLTEITRALINGINSEDVGKVGFFRVLHWPNEIARLEAAKLMKRTHPENRGDDFYNKYYSYCSGVFETPNVGVTAGLKGMLELAAGISTTVLPFNEANTFLGIGNGMVYGALTAAIDPDGGMSGSSPDNASSQFTLNPVTLINTATSFAIGDKVFFTDSTVAPNSLLAPAVNPAIRLQYSTITNVVVSGPNVTITVADAMRYQRSVGTYCVRAGRTDATDMISTASGGKVYKGCTEAVVEGYIGSKPTLTWQVDYTATECVGMNWLECVIGSMTSGSAPATAQTTLPVGTLLATSAFYPSPLSKGSTTASQQYVFALG